MPFALLVIGVIMLVAAVRNTQTQLVSLIRNDFTGTGNFTYWIVALVVIGSIGYVDKLKPLSDGLLILIIVALFLTRGSPSFPGGGFFKQLTSALQTTQSSSSTSISNLPGWAQPLPGQGPIIRF